jgi:uncharacterized membrane protein YkoI
MRSRIALAIAITLALTGAVVWAHGHHHHDDDLRALVGQLMDSALISLDEAVEIALGMHPGHAIEAELEGEYVDGKLVATYEVEIAGADGAMCEVMLDSRDGRMLKEVTEYEDEDEAELQELHQVLQAATLDLSACIVAAEAEGKGRAVEAELEMDDGIPVCGVLTYTGEKLYEVELDMRNGDVLEIELEEFDEHAGEDEDEDEDHDEDEEEHEHNHGHKHHDHE